MARSTTLATNRLLTQRQAAARLNVAPGTLQNWRWKGYPNIPFIKLGHQIRYEAADIEEFIRSHTFAREAV